MKSKLCIFIILLPIIHACSSVEATQEELDQKARNFARHMSLDELKYRYFVYSAPSIIFKRSNQLRYADYILADELSVRGTKAEEIQYLKRFSNASLLASYLWEKGDSLQGHKLADQIIKESGINFDKNDRSYQCWANNLDGYRPKSYTVYQVKENWYFESSRSRYSTHYRLRLFVENFGSKSIYRGHGVDYRLIGSCSNGYQRPPNCRVKPSRSPSTPNYCNPA